MNAGQYYDIDIYVFTNNEQQCFSSRTASLDYHSVIGLLCIQSCQSRSHPTGHQSSPLGTVHDYAYFVSIRERSTEYMSTSELLPE